MTEATTLPETKRPSPLDDIVVKKPEASGEKTRKYLCGIKNLDDMKHLEFQIRVGPATFAKQTFVWEGQGDDAKQVFLKGAINVLTEKQVVEIQEKLRYRYLRRTFNKGVLVGVADIDASDSGGVTVDKDTGEHKRRPPAEIPGRTVRGDVPLKDMLTMDVVYEDKQIRGRVITVAEAKETLRAAEEEAGRELESVDATFETGRGGKAKAPKEDAKIAQAMKDLASAPASRLGTGAGRLPEGK